MTTEDADTANPTFVSYRVQPLDDPVQIGGICNGNQGCVDGNRNLLDFIDCAVALTCSEADDSASALDRTSLTTCASLAVMFLSA